MSEVLRVLLVDDQPIIRSGFAMMLSVEDDLEVVGEASDGREAIELARAQRPDVIVMDVQMPVMDGIAATREIVAEELGRVIILTTFDADSYLFDALRAGASGFLLKNAEAEQLVEALRAVGHGHALLAPEVTKRVIEQMSAPGAGGGAGATGTGAPLQLRDRRRPPHRRGDGQDARVEHLRQAPGARPGGRGDHRPRVGRRRRGLRLLPPQGEGQDHPGDGSRGLPSSLALGPWTGHRRRSPWRG